ncbi:MAG: ACT domain-containing protein [Phycisphaerales bacterium JB039]
MLKLETLPGTLSIGRLPPDAPLPDWLAQSPIVAIVRSERELSILCATSAIAAPREGEWRDGFAGWRTAGTLDFDAVGIMSRLSGALAARAIPLLAISSYEADYLLVDADRAAEAERALLEAGFAIGDRQPPPTRKIEKVNLARAMASFPQAWRPKIIADVNDCQVKVARLTGAFEWHHHATEDELFLVIKGALRMLIREHGAEREIRLEEGECLLIPRGTEHLPIADEECHVLLVEPATTLNTGNAISERTAPAERL